MTKFQGEYGTDEVIYRCKDGIGEIVLNRPKSINALTTQMCYSMFNVLNDWAEDNRVEQVHLSGSGERGFCAGADVRVLRTWFMSEPKKAIDFLELEYKLDQMIFEYPKPVTAVLDGISMGGGLGLGLHTSHRIGTASTQMAMPEVTIGLWPDVGVCYELSRMPGQTGVYLAMTGIAIDASSALWAGLLDQAPGTPETSQLAKDQVWIAECFVGENPVKILDNLKKSNNERANQTAKLIETKSPWSVAVSLEAIRRAAQMPSVNEVLNQDRILAHNFVSDSDLVEGVRAQLVDKDRQPKWRHSSLLEVSKELVDSMFAS